jgi:hypothetical protein
MLAVLLGYLTGGRLDFAWLAAFLFIFLTK